jgi:hypothetical protein
MMVVFLSLMMVLVVVVVLGPAVVGSDARS